MPNNKIGFDAAGDVALNDIKMTPGGQPVTIGDSFGGRVNAGVASGTGGFGKDVIRYYPVDIAHRMTVDKIELEVLTAQATYKIKFALYDSDPLDNKPKNLLEESGDLDAGTNGIKTFTFGTARELMPGRYWMAAWVDQDGPLLGVRTTNTSDMVLTHLDFPDAGAANARVQLIQNLVFAANFPNPALPTTTAGGSTQLIRMNRSA